MPPFKPRLSPCSGWRAGPRFDGRPLERETGLEAISPVSGGTGTQPQPPAHLISSADGGILPDEEARGDACLLTQPLFCHLPLDPVFLNVSSTAGLLTT
jgi:hypothetical protein